MALSLRLPKLYGGPAETPKKIPQISKVSEIPEIFVEIPKISEKKGNANFIRRLWRFLRSLRTCFEPNE